MNYINEFKLYYSNDIKIYLWRDLRRSKAKYWSHLFPSLKLTTILYTNTVQS